MKFISFCDSRHRTIIGMAKRDNPAKWRQAFQAFLEVFAGHCIQNDIHTFSACQFIDLLYEIIRPVIDDFVGPKGYGFLYFFIVADSADDSGSTEELR